MIGHVSGACAHRHGFATPRAHSPASAEHLWRKSHARSEDPRVGGRPSPTAWGWEDRPRVRAHHLPFELPKSYWLDLREHPPAGYLCSENRPVLILHGGRDYHVTSADLDGWRAALSHNHRAQVVVYPSANHFFFPGAGPSSPTEYYTSRAHVAPSVIDDIAAWVQAGD